MSTKAHLVIDQGTTYSTDLNLTDDNGDPLNLDGYYANSVMKKWYTSCNSVAFTTSINSAAGIITLYLDANTTTGLYPGRYVYDVDITDSVSGAVSRVVEGTVTVTPSVTAKTYPAPNTNIYSNSTPLT
jgi:hypothetical protein